MSEYQYYEFQALDRPLSDSEMKELRKSSTRAEITSRSFTNVYNFGDFGGSPTKMMEKYFDAHVYYANWGAFTLMLRLPLGIIDVRVIGAFSVEDVLDFWTTGKHVIIKWCHFSEDGWDEWVEEDETWIDELAPIREELEHPGRDRDLDQLQDEERGPGAGPAAAPLGVRPVLRRLKRRPHPSGSACL